MGLFRIWQPHTDEYMLVWNTLVSMYTLRQLSDANQAAVYQHYKVIVTLNQLDPLQDVTLDADFDPFWLAITMAHLGIPPMLGPKRAKWFNPANPRRARARLGSRDLFQEVVLKVIRDVRSRHGIVLGPDTLPIE